MEKKKTKKFFFLEFCIYGRLFLSFIIIILLD